MAASLLAWALRLFASSPTAPDYTVAVEQGARGDLARVFGPSNAPAPAAVAAAPPPAVASRFKLIGVAAPRDPKDGGLALISVDGKAPRAITVGRSIDEGWVLQSVSRRGAKLSSNAGADTLELDMPALPLPARGVPGVTPPAASPSAAAPAAPPGAPPGIVRPPVQLPSAGGVGGPNPGAPPGSPSSVVPPPPGTPGTGMAAPAANAPPAVFVPQEELTRARGRQSGAAEE